MGIFNKGQKPVVPEPPLTAEIAQAIYTIMQNHTWGNPNLTQMFKEEGFSFKHSKATLVEAKRLESEAIAFCRNNKTVTIASMKAAITSDLLLINVVGPDIIHYNPTWKADRSFAQFRAEYPYVEPVVVIEE